MSTKNRGLKGGSREEINDIKAEWLTLPPEITGVPAIFMEDTPPQKWWHRNRNRKWTDPQMDFINELKNSLFEKWLQESLDSPMVSALRVGDPMASLDVARKQIDILRGSYDILNDNTSTMKTKKQRLLGIEGVTGDFDSATPDESRATLDESREVLDESREVRSDPLSHMAERVRMAKVKKMNKVNHRSLELYKKWCEALKTNTILILAHGTLHPGMANISENSFAAVPNRSGRKVFPADVSTDVINLAKAVGKFSDSDFLDPQKNLDTNNLFIVKDGVLISPKKYTRDIPPEWDLIGGPSVYVNNIHMRFDDHNGAFDTLNRDLFGNKYSTKGGIYIFGKDHSQTAALLCVEGPSTQPMFSSEEGTFPDIEGEGVGITFSRIIPRTRMCTLRDIVDRIKGVRYAIIPINCKRVPGVRGDSEVVELARLRSVTAKEGRKVNTGWDMIG